MKATGDGGRLILRGATVARLGRWSAEGEPGDLIGSARLLSVNEFLLENYDGFALELAMGKMTLRGDCPSAGIDNGALAFHYRRG